MIESKYQRDLRWFSRFRDWSACVIGNFALNHIATPWYRAMIDGAIQLGLKAAANDSEGARENEA